MLLPQARGPRSEWIERALQRRGAPTTLPDADPHADACTDDDLQLALWMCYELHFQGFDDVDDRMEWDVGVLGARAALESQFVRALRHGVRTEPVGGVAERLRRMTAADDAPSLSRYLRREATMPQFREFVAHRSIYHLKEADPHTFAIPRLRGPAKAAMVEIQADEYGGGRFGRMHSTLFTTMMSELGLDTAYGAYVCTAPAITLATNNLMSMFGLHRRWRGAAAGHLASIEMTSSQPNRRYGQGLRRLGGSERACRFFDEHVEADAVHEQIAVYDMCESLAADQAHLAEDIVFGAACALHLDELFARHALAEWASGRSSLRDPARAHAA